MVREPAYCTATGKVLLSALGPDVFDDYLQSVEMQSFTPRTLTSKAELRREIRAVREKGFALDLEEFVQNLCCVAIPLPDHNGGAPLAAISIAMPKMRFEERQRLRLVLREPRPRRLPSSSVYKFQRTTPKKVEIVKFSFLLAQSKRQWPHRRDVPVHRGVRPVADLRRAARAQLFAHGSFYMLGAYAAWQVAQWIGTFTGSFWLAALARRLPWGCSAA